MKIAYYLPEEVLDNEAFEELGWPADKIFEKTGIRRRHIARDDEFAVDLAARAVERLIEENDLRRESIDYLLYCTQSPDYIVPGNAGLLQHMLQLSESIGSLDINQGCTGFLYALSCAKGLLHSGQASRVLLVTADTWSKYINPLDKSTRSIFGDGAAATLLGPEDAAKIGHMVFGTDGSGADRLIVKTSGLRFRRGVHPSKSTTDASGNTRTDDDLFMSGPDVFNFTIRRVPGMIQQLLEKEGLSGNDIAHYVFHQANSFMLEHLRKKLALPPEKFHVHLEDVGNTVSSTIPITLRYLQDRAALHPGEKVLLAGFGVGYSWIATILTV